MVKGIVETAEQQVTVEIAEDEFKITLSLLFFSFPSPLYSIFPPFSFPSKLVLSAFPPPSTLHPSPLHPFRPTSPPTPGFLLSVASRLPAARPSIQTPTRKFEKPPTPFSSSSSFSSYGPSYSTFLSFLLLFLRRLLLFLLLLHRLRSL